MSPGSVAETVYGRRGGGWAPKPTTTPATPAKPKDPEDRYCRICLDLDHPVSVKIADHPAERCPACGGHLCHHQGDDEQLCWEGRARCAAAKRDRIIDLGDRAAAWRVPLRYLSDLEQDDLDAGINDVELQALARHPNPPRLAVNGYVLDTNRVDAGHRKRQVC
jgi:hypothetical protein